jgi:hypothetical protein
VFLVIRVLDIKMGGVVIFTAVHREEVVGRIASGVVSLDLLTEGDLDRFE